MTIKILFLAMITLACIFYFRQGIKYKSQTLEAYANQNHLRYMIGYAYINYAASGVCFVAGLVCLYKLVN